MKSTKIDQMADEETNESNDTNEIVSLALAEEVVLVEDIEFGEDSAQVYDVFYREGAENAPVVFLIHGGNTGNATQKEVHVLAPIYTEIGFVVVAVDFRDNKPIHDMACAVAHFNNDIDTYGGDSEKIIMHGLSFGGNSSMIVYNQEEDWLKYCDAPSTELDFVAFIGHSANGMGATDSAGSSKMSALNHIDATDPPAQFIYGALDTVFDQSEPEEFIEKLNAVGVEGYLYVNPDIGHGANEGHASSEEVKNTIQDFALSVTMY